MKYHENKEDVEVIMSIFKLFGKNLTKILNKKIYSENLNQKRTFKDLYLEDLSNISTSSIRSHFRKNEIKFIDSFTNLVIGCQFCEKKEETLVNKANIFVNKRTGAFTCDYCRHTGTWSDLTAYINKKNNSKEKVTKDPLVIKELDKIKNYVKEIKKNTRPIEDGNFFDLTKNFNFPESVTKCVMNTLDVRLDITRSNLYFPLKNPKGEVVGYKVLKSKQRTSTIEPKLHYTASSGVLVHKSAKCRSNTAVVVAEILDFLILVQSGVNYHIICLPNGKTGLSQYILPCFEEYSKLILWIGNDLQSVEIARDFAKKLIEKRCSLIRHFDKVLAPHLDPNQDFKGILERAHVVWHKSITTFASLREDVYSDLQNIDKIQGVKWTKYPVLNKILKGHRRGELTVFTGPTGSGKTTFISDYSLDLAKQGVNTLWGSFEIRNVRLARTMLQQLSGIPLDEHIEKFNYWADMLEELPIYFMTFHGQESIKVVMEAIEHATYVHDIAHVIIDNLQFMMGLSEDFRNLDRFYKQDLIVANFRTFATRRNCHVTLVIHPRKEKDNEDLTMSSIFGGAKASQEADNILIIQDKRLAAVKGKKYLQIAKNRYSGELGIFPLDFDKNSLSFAPKKKRSSEKKCEIIEPEE